MKQTYNNQNPHRLHTVLSIKYRYYKTNGVVKIDWCRIFPFLMVFFPLKALSTLPLNCVDAASDRKPIGVNWHGNARYRAIFVDFISQGGQHSVTWYLRHFKLESAAQNKNKPLLSGNLKSYELTESWPISAGLSWGNGELRTLHTSAHDSFVYLTIRVGKPKKLFYLGYENVFFFSFRVFTLKEY